MRAAHWRCITALVVLVLVAAGCGSDRGSDDEGADPADGSTTTSAAPTSTEPEVETFGDLESPCGPGDASGATNTGVTDDEITIGYGDDAGFAAAPGLDHELTDAVEAMIDWCNDQGGINGRTVSGNYYDAKVLEVNNAILSACNDGIFMLVGQGWVLDSAQEETRIGCGLGSVPGYAVSPEFAHGPLMVASVPNPADYTPAQHLAAFAKAFPDAIAKTAGAYANHPATLDTFEKAKQASVPFGYQFLGCDQIYGISGEDDWRPLVQNLKNCGAEVVMFVGSPDPNFQNFLVAAQQLDYDPLYLLETNFYTAPFAAWNAANQNAGDKVYLRQTYVPLEEASTNPATQAYIDIVSEHGGDISQLGAQATGSFLLWATAAKACGSNLTRDCIFEEIAAIGEWTGGGLHVVTRPTENMPPDCGLLLKLTGPAFERVDPLEPGTFDCDPSYVQPVVGEVVDRVKLGPDRITTLFGP